METYMKAQVVQTISDWDRLSGSYLNKMKVLARSENITVKCSMRRNKKKTRWGREMMEVRGKMK